MLNGVVHIMGKSAVIASGKGYLPEMYCNNVKYDIQNKRKENRPLQRKGQRYIWIIIAFKNVQLKLVGI